jgi:hypothetical protein
MTIKKRERPSEGMTELMLSARKIRAASPAIVDQTPQSQSRESPFFTSEKGPEKIRQLVHIPCELAKFLLNSDEIISAESSKFIDEDTVINQLSDYVKKYFNVLAFLPRTRNKPKGLFKEVSLRVLREKNFKRNFILPFH